MNGLNIAKKRPLFVLITAIVLIAALSPVALADTDGTEPKITQQPDQLVLQLGTRWAGVEFELRTDAGIFPAPVVVDEYGILTMDLGGSTTYTLSCIYSSVPIPSLEPEQTDPSKSDPTASKSDATDARPSEKGSAGLPLPAVIFFIGLAAVAAALAVLHIIKKRREVAYEEWEDGEDGPWN